jgi:hypothetical protein
MFPSSQIIPVLRDTTHRNIELNLWCCETMFLTYLKLIEVLKNFLEKNYWQVSQ